MTGDVHGDVWARGASADHAVNVVAGGPPDWLRAVLLEGLDAAVSAYPDEREAVRAVAERHERDPAEVVLLNGAAHGFALIAEVLGTRRAAVVHPQFSEPGRVLTRAEPVILPDPYRLDPGRIPDGAELVVVGNPTNPTGVLHPGAAIEAIIKPGRVVVVDEAFMDFVPGEAESLASTPREGVVVLRSLTKILGVPGLRVGYLLAQPELAAALRARRQAWPVNGLALLAAQAATAERIAPIAERAQRDREALADALGQALGHATVHRGSANFVLLELCGVDATRLAYDLKHDEGIAIRPAGAFPGLTPAHVRLTARGGEADARLVAALSRRA